MKAFNNAFPWLVGLSISLIFHFWISAWIGPFYTKLLLDIGINLILAVSLNVVNGFTGQFSIGHAAFMAIGGYVSIALTYYLSFLWWGTAEIQGGFLGAGEMLFVLSCISGGVVAAVAGFVVGLPSLRLRGDYLAIVTLGFGEIVRVVLQRTDAVLYTREEITQTPFVKLFLHLGGALGFTGAPAYTHVFWVGVMATLTLITCYRLKESTLGRAYLAIRENEVAAESVGINSTRYKVQAFVVGAFFAGIAGALFAHEVGTTLNPKELGFLKSFEIVIMVVLGGMGSISGAVLAAIGLTLLPELLRGMAQYRMILYALILIFVMIGRPQGLFGIHEVWERSFWRALSRRFWRRA